LTAPPILRPYQIDVVAKIEKAITENQKKILLVAPTGSGKTVIASEIIKRAVAKHQTVLFLAHRREIILQTSAKLMANGVRHGIIMAGVEPRPMAPVQVASIDTLHIRGVRSESMRLPPADLLIFDEAHRARGRTREHLLSLYPDTPLLGMTATPCRGDGRGLGNIFKMMIEAPQVAALIESGYLVKPRVYAPIKPNLRGVRTQQGDYAVGQLEQRMDRDKLVGDIVTHWHKFGDRRRTICFAVGVGHSVHIKNEFALSGVRAEHLDGDTPVTEREAILARLKSGETEVVTNCMVLTEGFDCPDIGCIILARPTKQMGLFRQMVGRGLRPADGKTDCIILDHSGAVWDHGLPEDHVEWTLDVDRRAVAPAHQARLDRKVPSLIECTQCSTLRLGGKPCPNCGFLPQRPAQYIAHHDGELGLVSNGKATGVVYDHETKRRWYCEITAIAHERGKGPNWPYPFYLAKFGERPDWNWRGIEMPPSPEVRSYVRSRQIAYAKSRSAA